MTTTKTAAEDPFQDAPEVLQDEPRDAQGSVDVPAEDPDNAPSKPYQTEPRNGLKTAYPLSALKQGPAPVDCPECGQRAVTKTSPKAGVTTQ
jgi:lipopolysaccharide-induced tumor necrosis factor-alpha factor